MSNNEYRAHYARLEDAASVLALRLPFIATIFSSLRREVVEWERETACVGAGRVRFHPKFMDSLDREGLIFVCAHEALHVAFLHAYRRGDRDPVLWNLAGDAIINRELQVHESNPLIMPTEDGKPRGFLLDWVTAEHGAEEVYQKLMQDAEELIKKYGGGELMDLGDPDDPDDENADGKRVSEQEVRTMVLQAAKTAYASGDKSQLVGRLVNVARASTTDWKEELRSCCTLAAKNDYSYRRFNRRFVAKRLYMPTLCSEEIGELVVGVDESGSMTQHQLDCIQMEMIPIVEDVRPSKVVVMYCTTEVVRVEEFGPGEEIRLTLNETGGTNMVKILDEIEERQLHPAACIIFTDLETPFPREEPDYPLLWGAVGASPETQAPVGKTVQVPV